MSSSISLGIDPITLGQDTSKLHKNNFILGNKSAKKICLEPNKNFQIIKGAIKMNTYMSKYTITSKAEINIFLYIFSIGVTLKSQFEKISKNIYLGFKANSIASFN